MKIRFINYRKEFDIVRRGNAFKQWFYFRRYWSGKVVFIGMRHWAIEIDFREPGSLFRDMTGKPYKGE